MSEYSVKLSIYQYLSKYSVATFDELISFCYSKCVKVIVRISGGIRIWLEQSQRTHDAVVKFN